MTDRPLKAAVVGVGYLGRYHAQKYARLAEAELCYCVDADPGRLADNTPAGAKGVTDYHEILGRVEVASIAVPTPAHFAVARDFLEAGCDVLLEKPMTTTLEEADGLIELARQKGRVLMIGHLERFNPPIRKLKDSVVRPAFIQVERLGPFKERAANIDVVLDLMIHDLDIILDLVHAPLERVSAIGVPVLSDKIDLANARLEFKNGAAANLTASRVSLGDGVRKIRIFQHESYTSIDSAHQKLAVFTLGEGDPKDPMSRIRIEEITLDRQDALEEEIKAFLEAARNRTVPPVTGEDGRRALAVAIEIINCISRRTPRPEDLV